MYYVCIYLIRTNAILTATNAFYVKLGDKNKFAKFFSLQNFQPPICDAQGQNLLKKRRKRQTVELDETQGLLYDTRREDLKVKVSRRKKSAVCLHFWIIVLPKNLNMQ